MSSTCICCEKLVSRAIRNAIQHVVCRTHKNMLWPHRKKKPVKVSKWQSMNLCSSQQWICVMCVCRGEIVSKQSIAIHYRNVLEPELLSTTGFCRWPRRSWILHKNRSHSEFNRLFTHHIDILQSIQYHHSPLTRDTGRRHKWLRGEPRIIGQRENTTLRCAYLRPISIKTFINLWHEQYGVD